ncbi:branched-chain amino acid ABC transporter substrate-binding protein [Paraburkholderia youngii]|uniref:branched-chain amino acid ABC transporter substrate-binding protein n=1 Tax=Paraburkholderia youngii TaxID=2782701 RepID=UPI003D19F609
MKKERIAAFIAAASTVLSLAVPCAAEADVKVAIAAPVTGPNASFGVQFREGAEAAAAAINQNGGLLGQKVSLVFEDDASDPKQGVSVANRIAADGIQFVIGHFNSGVSIPASNVYQDNGILEISPSSTAPVYTDRGMWNTFRVCGRDDKLGLVTADYILHHFQGKPIALVDDKTPPGAGLVAVVKGALAKAGVKPVTEQSINVGEKDFSALVTRLKALNVGVVVFGGVHTEGGLIARQMKEQGLNAKMIGPDGFATSEFPAIAGDAANGVLFTFGQNPVALPAATEAVKNLRAQKIEPDGYVLYVYAAMQVLAQGINQAKSTDPQKVAAVLQSGKVFQTVLGARSFDKKGDIQQNDFTTFVWQGNKYVAAQ